MKDASKPDLRQSIIVITPSDSSRDSQDSSVHSTCCLSTAGSPFGTASYLYLSSSTYSTPPSSIFWSPAVFQAESQLQLKYKQNGQGQYRHHWLGQLVSRWSCSIRSSTALPCADSPGALPLLDSQATMFATFPTTLNSRCGCGCMKKRFVSSPQKTDQAGMIATSSPLCRTQLMYLV